MMKIDNSIIVTNKKKEVNTHDVALKNKREAYSKIINILTL